MSNHDPGYLLEVEDLHPEIRLQRETVGAVDRVNFRVQRGETVGWVGESGCRKTIIGSSITRLLPAGGDITSGRILLERDDPVSMGESKLRLIRANDIGVVFQDPMTSLDPTSSVCQQIVEAVRLHRPVSKKPARAVEILDLVGVPRPVERIDAYPHQLSGGLRQRVVIAMAFACEPIPLIAGVPTTTAPDVTIQDQILALLDSLKQRLGTAIILVTHDMRVIAGRTDRVVVMYAGRIAETAEKRELFNRAHHSYTEALLASIPRLDQDTSQVPRSIPGLPPEHAHLPARCRFAPRCAYTTDRYREQEPALSGADPAHQYACFHPRNTAPTPVASAARVHVSGARTSSDRREQAAEPLLELESLTKQYLVTSAGIVRRRIGGPQAVTDVSVSVRRGKTLGVVGGSGCGRTTITRMVVGLEQPTSGRIVFADTPLQRGTRRRAHRDLQPMGAATETYQRSTPLHRWPARGHPASRPRDRSG